MNSTTNEQSSTDTESNDESNVILILWIILMVVVLLLPFCGTKRRRKLCQQRIRERRWIQDDALDEDDWYYARYLRQQEERRQLELERFRINKKQQDEIREQYLVLLMEKYTMTLSSTDIHVSAVNDDPTNIHTSGGEPIHIPATEIPSLGGSPSGDINAHAAEISKDTVNERNGSTPQENTLEDGETDDILEEMAIDGAREIVHVPLPGQKMVVGAHHQKDPAAIVMPSPQVEDRRQVPSGCAICLSTFGADERITWASNRECSHVFHHDCLVHWFHTVGIKDQQKQLRLRPDMSGADALDLICNFPKLCPCCRQQFFNETEVGTSPTQLHESIVGNPEEVVDNV